MRNEWRENVKLSVFVGSPKKGLEKARERVIWAILEAGHIPHGMELWAAGAQPTLQDISEKLDLCDVHVLLLGSRYGRMVGPEPERVGFTEWEYQQSVTAKRPILSFMLDDTALNNSWRDALPEPDEQTKLRDFRQKLRQTICKQYPTETMDGIDRDVVLSLNQVIDSSVLPANAGWIRARSKTASLLRAIQNNRFVERVLERVFRFRTLTVRVRTEPAAKKAAARLFWDQMAGDLRAHHYQDLFFESGSSLAYVAEDFERLVQGADRAHWRVSTNNALALLQLMLFTDVDTRRLPPAAPNPDDPYGAIFSSDASTLHREPPVAPRALVADEQKTIDQVVKLLHDRKKGKRLILATASGWDTTHPILEFRGPHVGSHSNMLFKRALFRTEDPIVLFLTRHKVDPKFIESRFKSRKDEKNSDGTLRYCYPVFGEELTLSAALTACPLAICVGYELEAEDGAAKLDTIREQLQSILEPVLAPHGFDLEYGRKEFRNDPEPLSGAFVAANQAFISLFQN